MPNTATRPPVPLVPSSQLGEDDIDPTLISPPLQLTTKKSTTYIRRKKRHVSISSTSEDETFQSGPSTSTHAPRSSNLVVSVEVDQGPRVRKRPIHFGFEVADTTVEKGKASKSTLKISRSPSPDPLDDDIVVHSNAKDIETELEERDGDDAGPEIVETTSKKRKTVDSDEEFYQPLEKSEVEIEGQGKVEGEGRDTEEGQTFF